ncbi:DedA family protein [Oscillatoria sp. CS-180]|uniref:DedA family protein n=1 Tax=Oscillatoria sp. CS-180 TaxID=3021720 RepID=UPI00232F6E93|nr:DedA family protein [Oscillatoria sp. CS-180]MDB9528953.1 DedA family protein [Oscillatoria sp. CS-180]
MLDWITTWLESLGYFGVFALMILEHLFPPIPSEVIMPLSGFISSRSNDMTLEWVIVAGSLGSLVGTLFWYILGRLISHQQIMVWVEKHGRWLALKPKDIEKAMDFFQEGGGHWIVGIGRVVPGVRTYVSVPAGLSHMPLVPYLFYSAIGTVIWTAALAIAGYFLGAQFERVSQFIAPISTIVLIGLGVFAIIWVWNRRFHRRRP